MAEVEHKNLTTTQLHEPKGASSASLNTCYVSDGAGSGSWSQPPYSYTLNVRIDDISTAGDVYVVAPVNGTISKIYSVIDGAIADVDAVLSFTIGASAITDSGITIAYSGSAAGDVDSSTPSAANTVTAGDIIKCSTDGASTNTVASMLSILINVGS